MPGVETNFIYVLFGEKDSYYAEAAYSIGTLHPRLNPADSQIIVFTDHPEKTGSWPVKNVSIAGQIGQMKGRFNYHLRVKLCCLLQSLETYPGSTILVDTDTFFKKSPDRLKNRLQDGCVLLHRRDSMPVDKSPFKNLQLRLPCGRGYQYGAQSCMYNSGVVGLRPADIEIVNAAIVICDTQLQRAGTDHICEQLAISEACRIYGRKILETNEVITHYYRTSARKYMHHHISHEAARTGREPWDFKKPIPYSYSRVQWFKFRNWLHK